MKNNGDDMIKQAIIMVAIVLCLFTQSCSDNSKSDTSKKINTTNVTNSKIEMDMAPKSLYAQYLGKINVVEPEYMKRLYYAQVSDKARLYNTTQFVFRDENYAVPQRTWLLNTFSIYFNYTMESLKVKKYANANDCDKHAALYWLISCYSNYRTDPPPAKSLSIAEIFYYIKGNKSRNHAINMAIVSDKDEIIFIEPQTSMQVFLSKEEMDSIYFVMF